MVLGYIFNRYINLIIYGCNQKLYNEYFIIIFISIYGGSYILSIIFYLIFEGLIASAIKHEENEKQIKKEILTICGYLLYYEKIPVNNDKDYDIEDLENGILIINNTNSIKKNNKISNKNNAIIITPDNKVENEVGNVCDKICSRFFPCCTKNNKYFCASCKLGFRKCYYNIRKMNLCCEYCKCCKCEECCSCCPCCQCCLCCKSLNIKESYEKEEIFCYAYKIQRKCSWFCDLLWKNEFITLIISNILVEIAIIGFEKKLNEDLQKNKFYQNIIIIIIYLLFFILLAIFSRYILHEFFEQLLSKDIKNIKDIYSIFIIFPIIMFFGNIIYLLVLYLQAILKSISKIFFGKIIKLISLLIDYFYIPVCVSFVKFFNYFETELLLVALETRGIDILSNSFVLSSFFIIYDLIVFIITDIYDCDTKILIWVQLGIIALINCLFPLFKELLCK